MSPTDRPIDVVVRTRSAIGATGSALPEHLADVVDVLGRSEQERGRILRGLLRVASRTIQSRGELIEERDEPYPRFSSGRGFDE